MPAIVASLLACLRAQWFQWGELAPLRRALSLRSG